MTPAPTVTVLVSSYNYSLYLGEALQSVLDQSWQDFELVVVDDGSTDGSLALARGFAAKDARVRVLQHPDGNNHGLPATLNLGIGAARGRWTAFLESDDRWHPQSLSLRLDALERSGAGVVLNDVAPLPMPGAGTAWFESYVGRVMREHAASAALAERTGGAYALRTAFLAENKIPTFSCAMIRTALLRECSPDTPVSRWLDWWIWAQAAQKTTFCFVPVKLTQWRLHRESLHNRIALGSYLRDYRNMWRGFRRQLAGSPRAFRILRQPFWLRLGARFRLMAGERGMGDALRRVFSRLDTTDGERGTPHRFPQRKRAD